MLKTTEEFTNKLLKQPFNRINVRLSPENPGVYLFFNNTGNVIYVGKAINLKNRLSSYLANDLLEKTKKMIYSAKSFAYVSVNSEVESLLLEAKLIKKFMPVYNIELKDDKSPLYILITNEKYPRVLAVRKKEIGKSNYYLGPFPSSYTVKKLLKWLRRVIPYSDHKIGKRACFYHQLGLCNPCPNLIEKRSDKLLDREYKKNITKIKKLLDGNIKKLKYEFLVEIEKYSKLQKYENAKQLRDKLSSLEYITQPISNADNYLENPNLLSDIRSQERENFLKLLRIHEIPVKSIKRVECFDISHIAGTNPTASMVTFINGEPEKSLYRHFRIRQESTESDTDSLLEVAKRRYKNLKRWGIPDLMLIDGGKGQVGAFKNIFTDSLKIPIIGIAKRDESIIYKNFNENYKSFKLPVGPSLYFVQRLRNEAHRFARRYHHKLMKKTLLA